MKRAILILIAMLTGCGGGVIQIPETRLLEGPPDGGVVHTNTVKFVWAGNEYAAEFRYTIDTIQSGWIEKESLVVILDEGWHTFSIRSRNILGEVENNPPMCHFLVDGITNGFSISPLFDSVALSSHVRTNIRVERTSSHSFEHIVVKWDGKMAEISEVSVDSSSFSTNSFPAILTKTYDDSLEIFLGMISGEFPSMDRNVATIEFIPKKTGTMYINIAAEIFDSSGNTIPIDTLQGGKIVIF